MMCGLARVSQGRVRVFGADPREEVELYRRIGVMTEHESTYEFLTGRAARRVVGVGCTASPDRREAAGRAIDAVDLADAADRSGEARTRAG